MFQSLTMLSLRGIDNSADCFDHLVANLRRSEVCDVGVAVIVRDIDTGHHAFLILPYCLYLPSSIVSQRYELYELVWIGETNSFELREGKRWSTCCWIVRAACRRQSYVDDVRVRRWAEYVWKTLFAPLTVCERESTPTSEEIDCLIIGHCVAVSCGFVSLWCDHYHHHRRRRHRHRHHHRHPSLQHTPTDDTW